MATPAKRIRRYSYNQDFEHLYLVANYNGVGVCLLCLEEGVRFTCPRKSNIKRHYNNKHADYDTKYPLMSKERLEQIEMWKAVVSGSKKIVSVPTLNLDTFTANRIVFIIAHDIVKNKEPFSHSEIFAKRLIRVFEMITEGAENQKKVMDFVENIPLSRGSITRRIRLLSANIRHQFLQDLDECSGFSIQLDGSIDSKSVEQVIVFFRIVFSDCSVKEHLFACLSLHERADAEALYNALKAELVTTKVPLNKLVSITTDSAVTMVECKNGLIARLRGDTDFPQFTAFRCLLHQQLTGTRTFMGSGSDGCIELEDINWQMRHAFITDVTEMINAANETMEGSMKFIADFFASFDRLEAYIESAINYLKHDRVPHFFQRLTKLVEESSVTNFDGRQMFEFTKQFLDALKERLADFSDVRAIVNYFKKPFDKSVRAYELIPIIAKLHPIDKCRLQYEIEDLRLDSALKTSSEAGDDIWRVMDHTVYPNLTMVYRRTYSYFGTTYLCESTFLSLENVKSTFRTRISDKHLQDVLHILTSVYEPDFDELARGWKQHDPEEA